MDRRLGTVAAYHARTMHHPGRYARSLGYMDWDTQPDPFRSFEGAERVALALVDDGEVLFEEATFEGLVPVRPLSRASLSQLLQDSLGLSAWKVYGEHRWSLRMNPSSGNLHPTEGYLVTGAVEGLGGPGVWHYQPHDHALERRGTLSPRGWAALSEELPEGAFLVGLTSIPLRESWKYGERAFRYCQHDLGHAIAALTIAAAGLGWRVRLLGVVPDRQLAALLGTAAQRGPEAEHPECLLAVGPTPAHARSLPEVPVVLHGTPRPLAEEHHAWPLIDEAIAATELTLPPGGWWDGPRPPGLVTPGDAPLPLRRILHQRRSAVAMDGRTGITREAFLQVLAKTLPRQRQVPFATLPWRPRVHLALWVHRVAGVEAGSYLLVRDDRDLEALRSALPGDWEPADERLPLYRLRAGDLRAEAAGLACGQAIAADGCFAAAMIASFEPVLEHDGPWMYRRLHWEAGAIGQVLYLEAEATGVRSTGIGCFFDDATHRALGLPTTQTGVLPAWQDLYHFTVGGAVDDERLRTEPPYAHLDR